MDTEYIVPSGKNIDEFYTNVSKALNFPEYFGKNLDALNDSLWDWFREQDTGGSREKEKAHLVFAVAKEFKENCTYHYAIILEIFLNFTQYSLTKVTIRNIY